MHSLNHLVAVPATDHRVGMSTSAHMVTSHAISHRANRLPVHTARRTSVVPVSMSVVSNRSLRLRCHGASRAIRSVARSAAPARALNRAPARLASEDVVVEAIEGAWACAVDEGSVAEERDVVEAEVPDGGVDHAVGGEGHHCADYGAGEDVVPVVVFVDGEGAADEAGAENGRVQDDQLPHGWVVVGEDLELCVEVKIQEDKASKGSSSVARWHRLQAVINLLLVSRADAAVEHNLAVTVGDVSVDATLVAVVC